MPSPKVLGDGVLSTANVRQPIQYLLRILLLLSILSFISAHATAEDADYAEQLILRANKLKLWQDDSWNALLHYRRNSLFAGVTSEVAEDSFFLSSTGSQNPQQELEATIRAFFTANQVNKQHPQCRFKARFAWLNSKLNFDFDKLSQHACPEFEEWYQALNPAGITLIFPSAFLNNPASMFGHTLVRIDSREQDEKSRLLDYTAGFAAATGEEGAVVYAMKGLLGGYYGYFSVAPYYIAVRKYSDLEHRDIWEYKLNLKQNEVQFLLQHLWELRGLGSKYLYLSKNCSYYLLSLFEAARPFLKLREKFSLWAIPVDTIRITLEENSLLHSVRYRPARATKLRKILEETTLKEHKLAKKLVEHAQGFSLIEKETSQTKSKVFKLAYEYLHYQHPPKENDQYAQLRYDILSAQSSLQAPAINDSVPRPDIRPDEGHETSRFTLLSGYERDKWFYEVQLRPAFHDLLDPWGGYSKGSGISVLDTRFRHTEESQWKLESFSPLQITSLSPRYSLLSPLSWRLGYQVTRKRFTKETRKLVNRLAASVGAAWDLDRHLVYGLIGGKAEQSAHFRDRYALGLGPSGGFLFNPRPSTNIKLEGSSHRFGFRDEHTVWNITMGIAKQLSKNHSLRLIFERNREFDTYTTSATISWNAYL